MTQDDDLLHLQDASIFALLQYRFSKLINETSASVKEQGSLKQMRCFSRNSADHINTASRRSSDWMQWTEDCQSICLFCTYFLEYLWVTSRKYLVSKIFKITVSHVNAPCVTSQRWVLILSLSLTQRYCHRRILSISASRLSNMHLQIWQMRDSRVEVRIYKQGNNELMPFEYHKVKLFRTFKAPVWRLKKQQKFYWQLFRKLVQYFANTSTLKGKSGDFFRFWILL